MDIFERIKARVGACAASTGLENLNDAAGKGAPAVWAVQSAGAFTDVSGEPADKPGETPGLEERRC